MKERIETDPYLLFKGAKNDIIDIRSSLKDKESPVGEKAYKICFNATRAVEKMFKGYIRYIDKSINIQPLHDLQYLYKILLSINNIFNILGKDIDNLNHYKSWTGYEPKIRIEKYEVISVLKSLKTIYNFHPIKEAREILHNKYKYNTLPDTIMDTLLNMANNNDILICYKHQNIDQSKHATFKSMKLNLEVDYNNNLLKYSKITNSSIQYILCHNINKTKKELFFVDRDFNQKQAELFIKSLDKEHVK